MIMAPEKWNFVFQNYWTREHQPPCGLGLLVLVFKCAPGCVGVTVLNFEFAWERW